MSQKSPAELIRNLIPYFVLRRDPVLTCRAYNNAAISHTSTGNWQTLTFNSERWDDGDFHSTSVNTSRMTIPYDGTYVIDGGASWAANVTGYRRLGLYLNGTTFIKVANNYPGGLLVQWDMTISTSYKLSAGNYVELRAWQNSGGNLNVLSGGNYTPEFTIARIRV